jgi:hypothetical protein
LISIKNQSRLLKRARQSGYPPVRASPEPPGELALRPFPGAQSIVACVSWPREKNAFRYSRSSPWHIAEGVMQLSGTELVFAEGNACGILDYRFS